MLYFICFAYNIFDMVPRFTEFYIPVLQVMSNVEPIEINELIDKVAEYINLSEEDKEITTESGNQFRYRSNISWAVTDLNQGNFIERVKRGNYVITISGLELLEENLEKIDRDFLAARSESFRSFMEKKGTRKGNSTKVDNSLDERLFEEDFNNIHTDNSSEVSLKELYEVRETLKKAKISTSEIDAKIKELENERDLNDILFMLSKSLPKSLGLIKKKITFSVDYIPDEEICITLGTKIKHLSLGSNGNGEKNDNCLDKQNSYSLPKQKVVEETKGSKSTGIWIEPYKDRMILIRGDIKPFDDLFSSYGGRRIKDASEGWTGWIFMKNREEGLRKDLSDFVIDTPNGGGSVSSSSSFDYSDKKTVASETTTSPLISKYVELFSSLKSFNFLGITGPHKAIMLIAIFKGIRNGLFQDNKIKFSTELEAIYNDNWNLYKGGFPTLGAVYPFVHLGREPFFMHKLIRPIIDYDKTWSRHSLDRHIEYAMMDKKLVELVKDQKNFDRFVDFLSARYCSDSNTISSSTRTTQNLTDNVRNRVLMNHRDAFYTYLAKSDSKHGKSYSKKSIVVYVRGLNSAQMNELVSQYAETADIFNVVDLNTLSSIKNRVAILCSTNKAFLIPKSALSLYIKYVESLG